MMSTMDALKEARRNGAAASTILVTCDQRLTSRAYMALKADDRISQLGDGRSVFGFLVPVVLWDEMLLSLEG